MALRSIAQKADILATFRHVSVFLMETDARWTPLTPELEVKLLFGRHLWEFAQHAEMLGQRTAELRAGLHYTRPPVAEYMAVLGECAAFTATADRVHSMYEVIVPDLARRYAELRREADPLLDQPTIRILERILPDLARLPLERQEMLADVTLALPNPDWVGDLRGRLAAVGEFASFRPAREEATA